MNYVTSAIFLKRNLFSWRHFDTISDLLFNSPGVFASFKICNFSEIHRLHFKEPPRYPLVFCMISHFISNTVLLSFRSHIFLDSSMLILFFLWAKEFLFPEYRFLNGPSVSPIYLNLYEAVFTVALSVL